MCDVAYLVQLGVLRVVVLQDGAVAGHVVGVGEAPASVRAGVPLAHVEQVAVEEDGVSWDRKHGGYMAQRPS